MTASLRLIASALLLAGCVNDDSGSSGAMTDVPSSTTAEPATAGEGVESSTGVEDEPVTYYQHVRPILEVRCAGCHVESGIGPFSLASYDDARTWASVAVEAVEARRMPPFRADDQDCWPIADVREMAPWEKELLRAWRDQGAPAGDSMAAPQVELEVPPDLLGPPTRTFVNTIDYAPGDGDVYRCFLVDPELSAEWSFFAALSVVADNWARVHHAIVYAIPPEQVPAAEEIDTAEDGQGWTCYFGPKVDGAVSVGSYSPGAAVRPYPGGTSVPLAAGSRFIVEAHFHETLNDDPVSLSVVAWEFAEPVTRFPHGLSMFNSNFIIPAGAPSVTAPLAGRIIAADQEPANSADPNEIKEAKAGLVWGVDFHMHMRGKTARVDLVRKDGTRQCLLRVPDWDDAWQGPYVFAEPIAAAAGDRLEATCEWDNSPANQPIVDGVQLQPVDLTWGFGALDEMCNASLAMTLDE